MLKIISGAQTGVDRAALDAALNSDVQCGGWVPGDRVAEDGLIPPKYPVQALPGAGYIQRTKKNIHDSSGTVIIYFGQLSGGTEQTLRFCLHHRKPYLLLDAQEILPARAGVRMFEFLKSLDGEVLNIAGPRASGEERAYDYTLQSVRKLITIYEANL